jgi:protein phosphatase methylesterase 1
MSDLQKKMFKKAMKPPMPMPKSGGEEKSESDEENEKEEMKDDFPAQPVSNFGKGPIMPTEQMQIITPSQGSDSNKFQPPMPKKKGGADFSPTKWEDYFDKLEYLEDGTSAFIAGTQAPVFVCLHGAGHSAQSFACLAGELKKFASVVAFDFRGHGYSNVEKDKDVLSTENLVNDTLTLLKWVDKRFPDMSIIIVGHSMGGAIATKACYEALKTELPLKIQGLLVIDVVEGTAMEALPFMEEVVKGMPKSFKNVDSAIQWSIRSATIKNLTSAKVSIPPQLQEKQNASGVTEWTWKNDLMSSQTFWPGWFKNLTQTFLDVRVPKLLLLAGAERMDKELTIAQMQGKFKLKVIYDTGHSIQEDNYMETAKACYGFLQMFRIPITTSELEFIAKNGVGKFHPNLAKNPYE